jgi:hypothetical protein
MEGSDLLRCFPLRSRTLTLLSACYGASGEWSYKVADKPSCCYDLYATMLHLLGIDHKRLTYRNKGIDRRITDVFGEVIREIVA